MTGFTSKKTNRSIVFLDRDGVLNADDGYPFRQEQAILLPGVGEGLRRLSERFLLVVITNQSGVARAIFEMADVFAFHRWLQREVWKSAGVRIDGFYVCPHHPEATTPAWRTSCLCRKPGTELLDVALREFSATRAGSYLIGDRQSDIECARRAGIHAIQVESSASGSSERHAHAAALVSNLAQAADLILQTSP